MRATSLSWSRIGQIGCRRSIAVALWSSALVLLSLANARGESCIDYRDYMHAVGSRQLTLPGKSVAVAENRAYVVGSNSLRILDVTLPSSPQTMGSITVSDSMGANDVAIVGTHAYVAAGVRGLRVVDASNPFVPVIIGTADTPGSALDVAVSGNYCYMADGVDLKVIDISNPQAPQIVGSVDPAQFPVVSLAVSGTYVYAACSFEGLSVIDVSTPTMPIVVGSVSTDEARDVAVAGNFAYVAAGNVLQVVDVSNPAFPYMAGSAPTGAAKRIAISGNTACVVGQPP